MTPEKKIRKYHRLAPCPHYDVERIESWLTDMASEGFHLEKEPTFMGFFAFTKGEPKNVRYRLEPKQSMAEEDSEKPDHEAQALYAEYGWEFVAAYGLFYIYRSVSPDAREMNTDPQVQAVAMKGAFKQLILPLIVCILSFRNSMTRLFSEPIRYLVTQGIVYTAGFFLVMVGAAVLTLVRFTHLIHLRQKLKNDIPLDHKKPWRKRAFFSRFVKVFGWSFYVFILVVILTHCASSFEDDHKIGEYTTDPPFVTIADLAPDGNYTLNNGDVGGTVVEQDSYLAPLYMEWHEDATVVTPDGRTIDGRLDVIYYETKAPWIAEGLAKEFYKRAQGAYAFGPWETPDVDVDYAIAYTAQNSGHPTIIMQHGNIFIQGYIDIFDDAGSVCLDQWARQMAEMMKE